MELVHSGHNLIIAIYAVKKNKTLKPKTHLMQKFKKKEKILNHIIVDGVFR